jgi:outer membrane biogenesis lipoprotein LolB
MRCLLMAAVMSGACSAETAGESVQVRWVLDQDAQSEHADFDTATGFRVHLDEARIELASAYLYAPPTARLSAIAWLERSFVSVAQAHGGVDNEKGRRVLAEWTKPMEIDALGDSPVELLETTAEGGVVDAVKLQLKQGVVAHVRGTAERAGKLWSFAADVTPEEAVTRAVELIELEQRIEPGSVVHVGVQPRTWLDLCDFSHLGEGDAEAVMEVSSDNQVGRAISIGVRSPNAFHVYIEQER